MTIFSTNFGGGMAPMALPWLHPCFGPPLGNFLRTPLTVGHFLLYIFFPKLGHGQIPRLSGQDVL